MADTTFALHARQLLTMPDHADALQAEVVADELADRDRQITGAIDDAGVLVEAGNIAWFGPWADRPDAVDKPAAEVLEADVVMPGWIDCHTHSVFVGERADEFAARNAGRSYVDTLEAGGGILDTVAAVRQASTAELADTLFDRVFEAVSVGVTTLEVKSGYGLTVADELKMLKAIERVDQRGVPCELVGCFLGAHAVPASYHDRRDAYVELVCEEMIPAVADQGLADYCDVFCDRGAFDVDEARQILTTGQDHGLIARIHADQLSDAGAAKLAAELGAASADHLEYAGAEAVERMAAAGVVGVLMPAVNLTLGATDRLAPARQLLRAGGEVAVATDFNPGSAMTQDLGLMVTLACTLHKLTPGEALRAVTVGAAKALRRDDIGRVRAGAPANLTLLSVPSLNYIPYHFGTSHVSGVVQNGQFAYWTDQEAQ